MAGLTLTESQKALTINELQAGVIETMAKESKILSVLPFLNVQGNGYSYNVETGLAGVGFRDLNAGYTTTAPKVEQRTEFLAILGGEAIVDNFQIEVHSNVNDLMAIEVALTAKAVARKYEETFLSGDPATEANTFEGLITRVKADQKLAPQEDIQVAIDELLDKVQGGADALIMNKATRRKLTAVARTYVTYRTNEFGVQVAQYGGVDILDVDEDLLADGKIFAVRFGVREAVSGLQSTSGLNARALGEQDVSPQLKTRIEWYCGLAVFNDKAVAYAEVTEPVADPVA